MSSKDDNSPDNNSTKDQKKKIVRKRNPNKDYSYIKKYLLMFTAHEPFYGRLLTRMNIVEDFEHSTAYVKFNYDLFKETGMISYSLHYNPEFIDEEFLGKYKNEDGTFKTGESDPGYREVAYLMVHEIFHTILGHLGDRNILSETKDERILVNIAMDLAINSMISDSMTTDSKTTPLAPDVGFIPGRAADSENPEWNEYIKNLEPLKGTTHYFRLLNAFFEEQRQKRKDKGENDGDDEEIVKILVGGDGEGIDSHGDWEELPKELRDQLKSHMKGRLREASNHCRKTNSWGSATAHTQEIINSMVAESPVDWKMLLENAIGQCRTQNNKASYKKLSKKLPYLLPGNLREFTQPLAIFIDQSGSMSDQAVQLAFAQATNCAKHVDIDVYNFDTEVDESSHEIWKQGGQNKTWKRTRCGGTDFNAVKHFVESADRKIRRQWKWVIIVTDGYAPDLEPMKQKVLWLITPEGKAPENVKPGDLIGMMKYPNSDSDTFF